MANPGEKTFTKEVALSISTAVLILVAAVYFAMDFDLTQRDHLSGKEAPEIEFDYENGKPGTLSKQKGNVILVNFWASWCEACMEEMPALRALENHFARRGLVVLAINVEEVPGENIRVKLAGERMPQNLIFNVSKQGLRPYDIRSIPTSVLIDATGIVNDVYRGPKNWMDIQFLRHIESLLKQ